jgi:hypothetical protein
MQSIWIAVGSLIFLKPLRVGYVRQLATYVNLARSALASMPGDARPVFVKQMNRQSNIRVMPIYPPYGEAMAPDREFSPPMATSLRSIAGNDVSQNGRANRAYQRAIGSSRLARAASASPSAGEAGVRPRLYCRGEHLMTLLKAVLKALSDS